MSDTLELLRKMKLKINSKHLIGGWMQIADNTIAQILSSKKFDFITLDMEHGSIFIKDIQGLSEVIKNNNSVPLVRVNKPDVYVAKKVLEQGAGGVILPMIESFGQFNNIAQGLYYPPNGNRSIGFSNANDYGQALKKHINKFKPFIVCMVENVQVLDDLDDILGSKYLDSILIGPYDLSSSLGMCGEFNNPKFIKIIKSIRKKARLKNKPCGIHIVNPIFDDLKQAIKTGDRFIPFSLDTVLLEESLRDFK